jgi:hypothetical protein
METTFHDEERRPRTVLRARAAAAEQRTVETDKDRERVLGVLMMALVPFPEAREAVIAAIHAAENGRARLE